MAESTVDTSSGSLLGSLEKILGQGISAYTDTQLAQYAYSNQPTPYQLTPYGASPQGQAYTPTQSAIANPATWAIGLGLVLVVIAGIMLVKK